MVADPTPGPPGQPSLWRHSNFLFFWLGQSVSTLGSAVTFVALPLVGVLLLELQAFEVGVIATASVLPAVVVGLFVGPIVDRVDRRRLMIVSDIARALLMFSVPVAAWWGVLTYPHLIVVGGGLGVLTLLFNVAHQAFLPQVIDRRSLADGNGKLEASQSVAEVGGPGIAGWLIGIGGPAVALVVDAGSYLVSAVCLQRLRVRDTRSSAPAVRADAGAGPAGRGRVAAFLADTRVGFHLLWRDRVLRSVSVSYAVLALFAQMQLAVYMLFLVRDLGFSPTLIGVVFSLSSVIGFGSAMASGRLTDRLGVGRLVVIGQAATVLGGILLAVVAGPTIQAAAIMLVAEACFASGMAFYGVGSRTLIQARTADDERGRVIGASKVLTGVLVSAAGLIGGTVGAALGLRASLLIGAGGMVLALVLVLRRSVWTVRVVDDTEPDASPVSPSPSPALAPASATAGINQP